MTVLNGRLLDALQAAAMLRLTARLAPVADMAFKVTCIAHMVDFRDHSVIARKIADQMPGFVDREARKFIDADVDAEGLAKEMARAVLLYTRDQAELLLGVRSLNKCDGDHNVMIKCDDPECWLL